MQSKENSIEGDRFSTSELSGRRVYESRPRKQDPDSVKKLGRIRSFVFHPKKAMVVGFLIKRPDVALMFRREDMFVAYNGFVVFDSDQAIVVRDEAWAKGAGACKALGIKLDDCVIWQGLPVMTQDGQKLGYVGDVIFSSDDGAVLQLTISQGSTANTLLGQRTVPGSAILGFKRGIGEALSADGGASDAGELGALLVDDSARAADMTGGIAEKAGAGTAIAKDRATKAYRKVVKKAAPAVKEAGGAASKAAKVAGKAVNAGVYATGKQIGRAEGMFSKFKENFKSAMNGEDDE